MSTQQLSKQDHYDFGLRPLTVIEQCSTIECQKFSFLLKAVLRYAGDKKRKNIKMTDDEVKIIYNRYYPSEMFLFAFYLLIELKEDIFSSQMTLMI